MGWRPVRSRKIDDAVACNVGLNCYPPVVGLRKLFPEKTSCTFLDVPVKRKKNNFKGKIVYYALRGRSGIFSTS